MPQPPTVRQLTVELLDLYRTAWQRIQLEQARIQAEWLTMPRPRRLDRLAQLQGVVEHLMDTADQAALRFVHTEIPTAYMLGAVDSGMPPVQWARPDLHAVAQVASATYDDLLKSTRYVRRSTKQLVRTLTREQVGVKLLTGQTARQAAAELADTFAREGVAGITYANGARVGLDTYAEMVTRTQTALAYNQGGYQQFIANDVAYVECFDDPDCGLDGHEDEEKPNGQVYDVATMEEFPISHPNCVRSWGARLDVSNAQDAAAAAGTASDAQNADQAALAS